MTASESICFIQCQDSKRRRIERTSPMRQVVQDEGAKNIICFKRGIAVIDANDETDEKKWAHKRLRVTIDNCHDMKRVYFVYYRPREQRQGRQVAEFKQTLLSASQLLHWAVDTSFCDATQVLRDGVLFRCVAEQSLVMSFTDNVRKRSSPGTLRVKATSLGRICGVGILITDDERLRGKLEVVRIMLQKIASAARRAARVRAQAKKALLGRRGSCRALTVHDVSMWIRRIERVLSFMITGDALRSLTTNHRFLVKRWCMHFMGLIILTSGGQRPQVFAQLQVPSSEQLAQWENGSVFIELKTGKEKRNRYSDLPLLVLPGRLIRFISYHVNVVRPMVKGASRNKRLLFQPTTGVPLQPESVSKLWKSFLASFQPQSSTMTVMNIRDAYASMMMALYRKQRVFGNLNENQFLDKISRQMNTSPEQLRRTYIAYDQGRSDDPYELMAFWSACLGMN